MTSTFPRWNKTKLLNFTVQLLIGMLGAAILFVLFHLIEPTKPIATVDVTSLINRYIKNETTAKRSPEQMQKQVQLFANALENTLHSVAIQKQVILLPKEAVIAGAADLSNLVESKLKKQLTKSD